MLTQQEANRLLHYDPVKGTLTARVSTKGRRVGFTYSPLTGYVQINKRLYVMHRLMWFMFYGTWPSGEIDHKDRNPKNNCIDNLREATRQQNAINTARPNQSGIKGVYRRNRKTPWVAQIRINGKKVRLGSFNTAEEAGEAYKQAALKYHGEFASLDTRGDI